MGCHSLLQGIVPIHWSIPGLLPCRKILYRLSPQGSHHLINSGCYEAWPRCPFRTGTLIPLAAGYIGNCCGSYFLLCKLPLTKGTAPLQFMPPSWGEPIQELDTDLPPWSHFGITAGHPCFQRAPPGAAGASSASQFSVSLCLIPPLSLLQVLLPVHAYKPPSLISLSIFSRQPDLRPSFSISIPFGVVQQLRHFLLLSHWAWVFSSFQPAGLLFPVVPGLLL